MSSPCLLGLPLPLSHEWQDGSSHELIAVISDKFTGRASFPGYLLNAVISLCESRFMKAINLKELWYSKLLKWLRKFPTKSKETCYSEWLSTIRFDSKPRQSGRGMPCYNEIKKALRNCSSLICLTWGSESFMLRKGLIFL